jgi:hypothetical protein
VLPVPDIEPAFGLGTELVVLGYGVLLGLFSGTAVMFFGFVFGGVTKIETRMPPCFNRGMKGLPRLGLR